MTVIWYPYVLGKKIFWISSPSIRVSNMHYYITQCGNQLNRQMCYLSMVSSSSFSLEAPFKNKIDPCLLQHRYQACFPYVRRMGGVQKFWPVLWHCGLSDLLFTFPFRFPLVFCNSLSHFCWTLWLIDLWCNSF